MIWLIIYLIGAYVALAILTNRKGFITTKEDVFAIVIVSCSWPMVLVAIGIYRVFQSYAKTKNHDKERTA